MPRYQRTKKRMKGSVKQLLAKRRDEQTTDTDAVSLQANCATGRKLLSDAVQPRDVDQCTEEAVLCDPLPPEDVRPVHPPPPAYVE